jgi:hypothetical protein
MTLRYEIVPAEYGHIPFLAERMREADRREVWAMSRHTPREALTMSLKLSPRAWTALVDGVPGLMWGAARAGSIFCLVGRPWLLSSGVIEGAAKLEFLRRSREFVGEMRKDFPRLSNYVHAANTLSIRWLKWCGFTMDSAPVKIHGEDFFHFDCQEVPHV